MAEGKARSLRAGATRGELNAAVWQTIRGESSERIQRYRTRYATDKTSIQGTEKKLSDTLLAECRCLGQATVSQQHCRGAKPGWGWYIQVQTGLGSEKCVHGIQ
jgi:hypothetical protein